jgi:transcriptional regulator with XRE-family HTH domain
VARYNGKSDATCCQEARYNRPIESVSESLARVIRAHRKRLGLSQGQLAERLSVNRVSVTNWERGQSVPTDDNFERLAEVFGVGVPEIRYPNFSKHRAAAVREEPRAYDRALDRRRLDPAVYERIHSYLTRMERAGCAEQQIEEAHRLMVEFGWSKLHSGSSGDKSVEDQLTDIDASWKAIRESIETREGKSL